MRPALTRIASSSAFALAFATLAAAQTTTRASVSSGGVQANGTCYAPSISDDGRYVAFESSANNLVAGDTNGFLDVFWHDNQTGVTTRVSLTTAGTQGNQGSYESQISGNGRYVVFK